MSSKFDFKAYKEGVIAGIPIGLGYFAVAFSLGIAAKTAGVTPIQGFVASFLTMASAGEYAGFKGILEQVSVIEMIFIMFVANCRYLLMACSLSQRTSPSATLFERISMGSLITDEIFGVTINRQGNASPSFVYGTATTSVLPWATGTLLGIAVGNILPEIVVTALSVSLYGMFIAIIIPPARKDRKILGIVCISFALSALCEIVPGVKNLSSGLKMIILTIVIASIFAIAFPVKEVTENE